MLSEQNGKFRFHLDGAAWKAATRITARLVPSGSM